MTLGADVHDGRSNVYRWRVAQLDWVAWDGSLTTGALTIGTVDQGAAGSSSWLVAVTKTPLTGAAPTSASVGVASAQAVAANANRKGLVLVNTSANRISLGFGNAAVLDSGITLNPSGGVFVMDEFCFSTQAINAIASGAASNLAIQELT